MTSETSTSDTELKSKSKVIQTPCPRCHQPPSSQQCQTCPTTTIPHPRHDHPFELVGKHNGICPSCSVSIMPSGLGGWKDCACGLRRDGILERMGRCREDWGDVGVDEDVRGNIRGRRGLDGEEARERRRREKVEAERRGTVGVC
jgi:hypothetical protein